MQPDPRPDTIDIITRAWRALQRRPADMADDDCAWFVSRATREALLAHRSTEPGHSPVTQTGREVRLFGIRVISGENLGNHVLLLALEA
jgi:hypothetical protein